MGLIGMMSEPIVQMGPMLVLGGLYLLRGLPSSFSELRVSAPRACPSH